jgi:hypothetical protein
LGEPGFLTHLEDLNFLSIAPTRRTLLFQAGDIEGVNVVVLPS